MANEQVTLDRPPPRPENLSGPQASVGSLLGQSAAAPGSSVPSEMMMKVQVLQAVLEDLAASLPGVRPIMEQVMSVVKAAVMRGLQIVETGGVNTGASPMGAAPMAGGAPVGPAGAMPPPMQ